MTRGQTPVEPDDGLTTAQRRQLPILMVNTGDGKGKTSAAMGVALRSWAQGWPVGVYQFVKSASWRTGEREALTQLGAQGTSEIVWEQMGKGWSWTRRGQGQQQEAREAAIAGWEHIREQLAAERHRLWVLDEFTYPMDWGWIDPLEVAEVLAGRPGTQHVIITGRRCPGPILELADLVTDMTLVKHPFDSGRRGQAGIEW